MKITTTKKIIFWIFSFRKKYFNVCRSSQNCTGFILLELSSEGRFILLKKFFCCWKTLLCTTIHQWYRKNKLLIILGVSISPRFLSVTGEASRMEDGQKSLWLILDVKLTPCDWQLCCLPAYRGPLEWLKNLSFLDFKDKYNNFINSGCLLSILVTDCTS